MNNKKKNGKNNKKKEGKKMDNNIRTKLLEGLEKLNGKAVTIEQKGFIQNCLSIKKLNYEVEYDILKIKEEESKQYVEINLNQVYKVQMEQKQINIYVDNDIQIKIDGE